MTTGKDSRSVSFLNLVELLMRSYARIPRIVTVSDIERERARQQAEDRAHADLIEPQTEYLSPVQQWALIALRDNDFARLVIARLKSSTVTPPTTRDFESLVTHRLALRIALDRYELLPRGQIKASQLVIRLGRELGVRPPQYRPRDGYRGGPAWGDRHYQ